MARPDDSEEFRGRGRPADETDEEEDWGEVVEEYEGEEEEPAEEAAPARGPRKPGKGKRKKKGGKKGLDLILEAVRVGLTPRKMALAAGGVFFAVLTAFLFLFVGLEIGGSDLGMILALPGLTVSWALYFATFAAISRLCAQELRGRERPKLPELGSFVVRNAVSIFGIPFALLLGTITLLVAQYIVGWLGAIPYVGILFLIVLMLVYLVINVTITVVWLLGMWLLFPIVAIEGGGPGAHLKTLVAQIRTRPVQYIMDLGMVMLVLFVLLGMVAVIFLGALGLTQGSLYDQTAKYVQGTMRSAMGGGPSRDYDRSYSDREGKPPSKIELFLTRIFGELFIALMAAVIAAVFYAPLICVFYSGGCAAYLNARRERRAAA